MQVLFGQPDPLCEGPVVVEDSKYRAMGAMSGPTREASRTGVASTIDLADNTLSGVSARLGDTDELVPQNPFITHIATDQLQVGLADPGQPDTHGDVARSGSPPGMGWLEPQLTGLHNNSGLMHVRGSERTHVFYRLAVRHVEEARSPAADYLAISFQLLISSPSPFSF